MWSAARSRALARSSTRSPELGIPKPLVGERGFDLVAPARNDPDPALLRRLALAAGVDPERARGWAVAHALAWGYEQDGRWLPEMVAAARRLSGGRARGR
jgi:streptomycin 6-kinase